MLVICLFPIPATTTPARDTMSMGIQQLTLSEAAIHGLPNELLADIFDTTVKSVHENAQPVLVTLEVRVRPSM